MAVDYFLKIGDIKGESKDAKHKGWIDIESWSLGLSNSSSAVVGGGGGAGKASFQDVSVTKFADSASVEIFLACASGKPFDKATIAVVQSSDKGRSKDPVEYLILNFNDILISSYVTGGSGEDPRPRESVSFNFTKISMQYDNPDDPTDAPVEGGWDLIANKKV